MTGDGPRTPNADRARREVEEATTARPVRRLTDADAQLVRSRPFAQNVAIVVGAFAAATVIAELAGAANLGTAISFGQIGFVIALVWVLVRR